MAFEKTDGPLMYMGAYPCGNTNASYETNTLADYDPPYEYERVADYLAVGTRFCVKARGRGNNSVDTFQGSIAWD